MSTGTPLSSAPEMPSTSTQAAAAATSSAHWNYFNNANEADATKQPLAESDDVSATPDITKPETTSSTAYAFTGSALGSDSTANLNAGDTAANNPTTKNGANDEEKMDDSIYECNICLDTAKDAVVSMCGHLYCWPCLHQWLKTRPNRKLCPVCKAAISKEKVIPLYGRNSSKQEDPRNKIPPRPAGQRTEPEPQQGFQGFGFGEGFHMSFGIGAFPFAYFASSFNFGEPRPAAANRGTTQYEDEQQLSKLFLYLAFLCIAWLLFA